MKLVAVLGLALGLAFAGAPQQHAVESRQSAERDVDRGRLLGIVRRSEGTGFLTELDRLSLKPLTRRRVAVGTYGSLAVFSPDGSKLALAGRDATDGLQLVDVARMRRRGVVRPGGELSAAGWLRPNRLAAVVWTPRRLYRVLIDPLRRRIVERRVMRGPTWVADAGRSRRRLVVLLAPPASIGSARLAVIDGEGRVRTALLAEVHAGVEHESGQPARVLKPALAVDPVRERAYVVTAGSLMAEVELASLRVRYQSVTEPRSLAGRLRGWLEPEAAAKGPAERVVRNALWLGVDRLAVTGVDDHVEEKVGGRPREVSVPAGLKLIDARTRTVRTLDERTSNVAFTGRTLLAFTFPMEAVPRALREIGLTGYSPNGRRLFRLFAGKPVIELTAAGRYAYAWVWARGDRVFVVDTISGRIARALPTAPLPRLLAREPLVVDSKRERP